MKNNKGITMISLVMIILIMILLASVTAYEANDIIAVARVQSVTTDLLLIQAKVRIINEQIVFEKDDDNKEKILKGTKVTTNENYDIRQAMLKKGIVTAEVYGDGNSSEELGKYYILSQDDLNFMGLESLSATDGYVVNYETEEVIYLKGVKNANNEYVYRLQGDELK